MNGHKNWVHWNVSLWLNSDESMYRRARTLCRVHGKAIAAKRLLSEFQDMGIDATPDGAKYSVTAIRAALVGI